MIRRRPISSLGTILLCAVNLLTYVPAAACSPPAIALHFSNHESVDCAAIGRDGKFYRISIYLSDQKRALRVLHFLHSDEFLEKVELVSYRNPRFGGPTSGDAIKIVFPEKSSAIVYWDKRTTSAKVFWETD